MEGTGMLSEAPARQEGKKLWQYLSAASGNSVAPIGANLIMT